MVRVENKIVTGSDATRRGLPEPGFKIICTCGRERTFVFYKDGWDVYPCPYCEASGIVNKRGINEL